MAVTSESGAETTCASRWGIAPQRELRLLVDGIRDWLTALGSPRQAPRFLGVLEGEAGQGQTEILDALYQVCLDLGLHVVLSGGWHAGSRLPSRASAMVADAVAWVTGERRSPPECQQGVLPELFPGDLAREVATVAPGAGLSSTGRNASLGAEEDELRHMDCLSRALHATACAAPLILLVEDVLDADPLTLEVLRRLTGMVARHGQHPQGARVLLLCTTRPGGDLQHALGHVDVRAADIEAFRVVARGYSREDLRELTISMLGEEPPLSLRERLFRATRGNPRHLRWLLLHMNDRGGLRSASGRDVDLEMDWLQLVERRRHDLQPAEGALIDLLSQLEGPCSRDLVLEALALPVAAGGAPDPPPGVSLEKLEAAGWLRLLSAGQSSWSPLPDGGFSVQRAALSLADADLAAAIGDLLPAQEKARIHAALGEVLERHARAEARLFPVAAWHFCLAGSEERIAPAALAAGQYLRGVGCSTAALDLTELALSSTRGPPPCDLARQQAELLRETGSLREAVEAFSRLLEDSPAGLPRIELLHILAGIHRELGETTASADCIDRGVVESESASAAGDRIAFLAARAQMRLEAGDTCGSFEILEECLRQVACSEGELRASSLDVYRVAARIHCSRGSHGEAIELERAVLRAAEEQKNVRVQLEALQHLAELHELLSQWSDAETHLARAATLAKQSGSRTLWLRCLCRLGRFQRERKEGAVALRHYRQALSLARDACDSDGICLAGSGLLNVEMEAGRFDGAARTARLLVQMDLVSWLDSQHAGDPGYGHPGRQDRLRGQGERARRLRRCLKLASSARGTASDWLQAGHLLEQQGKLSEAERALREAIHRTGGTESLARAYGFLDLGRCARLKGALDAALQCFEHSLGSLGARPHRELLAEIYLEASTVLGERGDLAKAFDYVGRGLGAALEARSSRLVVLALLVAGRTLGETGELVPAAGLLEAAQQLAGGMGRDDLELAARVSMLRASVRGAAPGAASEEESRWPELARRAGSPVDLCQLDVGLAWLAYRRGDFEAAIKLAREGIDLARKMGLAPALHEFLHLLGVIESDAGNPRRNLLHALELLEQALSGAESMPCPRLTWEILQDMTTIFRARGKQSLAEEYERKASEIAAVSLGTLTGSLGRLSWSARSRCRARAPAKDFQICLQDR
jgi:tetratricopeptide (TPR) repeat protein